jgi:hypothetical protein
VDVPSKRTIVKTTGRPAYAPEILSGRNRDQNRGKIRNHTQGIGVARNRSGQHFVNVGKRLSSVSIKLS